MAQVMQKTAKTPTTGNTIRKELCPKMHYQGWFESWSLFVENIFFDHEEQTISTSI
jgi:hypothetical protein